MPPQQPTPSSPPVTPPMPPSPPPPAPPAQPPQPPPPNSPPTPPATPEMPSVSGPTPFQPWTGTGVQPPTPPPIAGGSMVSPTKPPSPKAKLLAIVVIIILVIAGVVAGIMFGGKEDKNSSRSGKTSSSSSASSKENSGEEVTIKYLNELEAVCEGGKATNTTDFKSGPSPHPIYFLMPSNVGDYYTSASIYLKTDNWNADLENVATAQLVGCFDVKSQGESKVCTFKDGKTINYYQMVYDLTIYETKSGKEVGQAVVNGPNTDCPFFAAYNEADPKLFGNPDPAETEAAVRKYVE